MSRSFMHSGSGRGLAAVIITAHLMASVPVFAQPQASQSSSAAQSGNVRVNRETPVVEPPSDAFVLPDQPSRQEIFRARVFAEPLVPVGGEPAAEDTAALGGALRAFHARADRGSVTPLTTYLENHPDSPWRASLLANVGTVLRGAGAFAQAMDAWDQAWLLAKDSTEPLGRAVADYAISQWLEVAASFGQADTVLKRLEDLAGRDVRGAAGSRMASARETAQLIRRYPEQVIASGPEALRVVLESAQGPLEVLPPALAAYRPAAAGTSLAEVAELARSVGLAMHPGRWTGNGPVPVPSVMHWKLGHFSPIVERQGDRYLVVDVALGGRIWVSRSTLGAEASGYFLVPDGIEGAQWQPVSDGEAGSVIGHSCPPGAPRNPPPTVTGCPNLGMCGYVLEPSSISLQLIDTPVGYTPPRGPAVHFRLTYQQHEILQPQIFAYAHAGPMWSFDWQRYVEEVGSQQLSVYHAGGRERVFDIDSNGTFDPHWTTRAFMVRVSASPLRYERRLPNGSVEVYDVPDSAPSGEKRVFISEIIDPQGQSLEFTWDAQFRLVAVTDAIGQVTELSYGDAGDPLRVTSVTDPFDRTATLQYTASGQLASITDVIGITSSFTYDAHDFVARMTTPYGTTTFHNEDDDNESWWGRMIEVTDPLGETEHLQMEWESPGLSATVPASEVPAGFEAENRTLDHFNTFYWSKQAWKTGRGDKSKAVVTHWMLKAEAPGVQKRLAAPHSVQRPLEGRVWYRYPDQPAAGELGWWIKPTHVGRRLDDGTSQVWEYTYDTFGNVLTATDPLGRRTSYTYATNGVDLLEVRQTTGVQNQLLASYANYTSTHRPQTIVDAAGRTTTATYNSAGQRLTVTNPKSETTTFTYHSTSGQLLTVDGPGTGDTTTYTYDDYGRVETVTNPDNDTTTTDYDLLDRVTRVTYPDTTYEAFTYDKLDVATVRDRLGRLTRLYHDGLRRVVGTRDPLGRTVQQIWGPAGTLDKLIDAKRQTTTWEWDLQGRVTREVRADAADTTYTYEAVGGRLKTVTDPEDQVKTYTYALDNAVASLAYTNANIATPTVSYTYDTIYPRLATMVDGLGTTTYAYKPVGNDGAGQVSSIDGARTNDTLTYTYDELGRVTTRALNAVGVTWAYDALGRLTSEVNALGTFTYTYDAASARPATATYPNGQTTTYSYFGNSGDRRLQTLHHKLSGGATLSKFDYTYDVVGNMLSWQQQADSDDPTKWTYGYDLADQLVAAVKQTTDPTPVVLQRYSYVYDTAGNRTTEQIDDAVLGMSVDSRNRLVSQQPSGTLRITGTLNEAAAVTINGKAASVDAANTFMGTAALVSGANAFTIVATDPAGNNRTTIYDITSSGASKTFTYDATGNMTGDGTRTFEWDAENRLVAVNVGTKRSEFTYDGDNHRTRMVEKESGVTVRDAQLFWVGAQVIEERLSTGEVNRFFDDGEQHNGTAKYLTRDHLNSVREVTNAAGTVITRNDYDPYGRVTRVVGTEDSRYSYTGHLAHGVSGLALPMYRAYDPTLGRWLSEDPLGLKAGDVNLFGYVGRQPTVNVDPDGRIVPLLAALAVASLVMDALDVIDIGLDAFCGRWGEAGSGLVLAAMPGPSLNALRKLGRGGTEVVQRAMSRAELAATESSGLLRGGRGGAHHVSDAVNSTAGRAQQRLALSTTPEVRVTLEVPSGRFSAPSRVQPNLNMPGGGMERTATGDVPVRILQVDEY